MDGVTVCLFAVILLCIFSGLILSFFRLPVAQARRIYWRCTALGAVAAFLCGYSGVARGIELAVFLVGGMVFLALRGTPYVKLGGKVYAFNAADRRMEDDDIPTTFGQDMAKAADVLQRRFGDSDIPDITGRNVNEALDALQRRFGRSDITESGEPIEPHAATPPPPPRTYLRVTLPGRGRGAMQPRLTPFFASLPLLAGGGLMLLNPAPPLVRSQSSGSCAWRQGYISQQRRCAHPPQPSPPTRRAGSWLLHRHILTATPRPPLGANPCVLQQHSLPRVHWVWAHCGGVSAQSCGRLSG